MARKRKTDAADEWLLQHDGRWESYRRTYCPDINDLDREGNLQCSYRHEELSMAPVGREDENPDADFSSDFEQTLYTYGLDSDRWFDYEAEREKQPHRKKDRHLNTEARKQYKREHQRLRRARIRAKSGRPPGDSRAGELRPKSGSSDPSR